MNERNADEANPLHRASFYIERLKYGAGDRRLELAELEEVGGQLEVLFREAGVTHVTPAQILGVLDHYAETFEQTMGLKRIVGRSIFLDGLMHGVALAGRCEADPE